MVIDQLQKEIESVNGWENISIADGGKIGKFIKKELNGMLNDIRHLYVNIRANQSDASMQLLALQVEEKTITKILDKLNNIQERKLELDKDLKMVSNNSVSEEGISEPFRKY